MTNLILIMNFMRKVVKYMEKSLIKIYNLLCLNIYFNRWGCEKQNAEEKAKKNN